MDMTTTADIPAVGGQTCSTAEVSVPGASVDDFPMVSFPGPTNLPLQIGVNIRVITLR
jgi:hypothetical protein